MNIPVLIVGIIFFAAGIFLLIKQMKSKKNNTESASAEIIGYKEEIESDTDNMTQSYIYYPIMKYYANGQWIEKNSDIGSGNKKYNPGEKVEIMYNPDKPEDFIIAGDKSKNIMGLIFSLAGIGVVILSFFAK